MTGATEVSGMASLPMELIDQIVSIVCQSPKRVSRNTLKNLRQVDRKFHESASRVLFSNFVVPITDFEIDGQNRPFFDLELLCRKSIARYVRNINFVCRNPWKGSDGQKKQLERLFPVCLTRLPRLQSIEFDPVNATTPEQELMTRDIIDVLCKGLYHHVQAQPGSSRFKGFDIEVGHIDHHALSCRRAPPDRYLQNLSGCLPLLKQLKLKHASRSPCEREASRIFDLLHSGQALTSVELCGLADIETEGACAGFIHPGAPLHDLTLADVHTSAQRLIALKEFAGTLQHVVFWGVDLSSGTWAEVFDALRGCHNLRRLEVQGCGYTLRGDNAHLRDFDVQANVRSSNGRDFGYLSECMELARRNREVLGDVTFV
ncbi:hypothetical protein BO70DRAFT_420070 [Aspergillus heteromorphus CBS 117.55]|uniref:F-box domain-containing protein n=1 Tax=Aspergillus heteromorphus CBS 117.55 TaxID=1448321 RepID=A0A317WP94_9EURO|nr:uncharacterized protein BO70DRAFT_420070 [Aspergillus heteromorphus CBS 117.55]PWY88324.1 hypothetical protein BO70DRAFT_420070 [Aspergillus heteromorphus CBS 117.55]